MNRNMEITAAVVVLLALAITGSGCGGGGGPTQPEPPPPPNGTAILEGYVVNAAAPSNRVPYAVVRLDPPGTSVTSDVSGNFRVTGLPAGTIAAVVTPGPSGSFWSAHFTVAAQNGKTTRAVVGLIPTTVSVPTRLTLTPTQVTLDQGGVSQFTAEIYAGLTKVNVVPTWLIENAVGTITPEGQFTATTQGEGAVVAWVGGQTARATVKVTGPQAPTIWSVFVDPERLPSSGGNVRFTLHASDGDEVESVRAEVYLPGQTNPQIVSLALVAGTEKDGTWSATHSFPANDAPYDSLGNQPDEVYTVRFVVKDRSGLAGKDTSITGFYQVRVRGAEAPPQPPGG
ncbi:MAG: hypothetical protein N2512_11375 [Armatimonadetes bacterium]|nr:hypothetical protein [Armatimonadota bacterium]